MELVSRYFDRWGFGVLAFGFVFLFALESRYGLRCRVQSRWQRIRINALVALPALAALRLAFIPAMVALAVYNQAHWRWGVSYLVQLHPLAKGVAGFLLLDYSMYLWHILMHRTPLLWRFHNVHHTDLDMDLTTALRFHFGEMIFSIGFRGLFVLFSGASPLTVILYELASELAINFHHSNWKLPIGFERVLNKVVVTPRMHGIHHSIVRGETDSNYATVFSWWDRLHHTLNLQVAQQDLQIGVPAYRDPAELTAWQLLLMPFRKTRDWRLPDGSVPERKDTPAGPELQA